MAIKFDRVLMHLRKSRTDLEAESRGEGETLAKHEKFLLKFAKENEINIINIRKELESGEFLIHRPEMLKTLNEVDQGLYDGVLCMDIDRLGRGKKQDQGILLETFKNSKTKIITPRKVYDLNDEWDEEYVDFEQFMAYKELKYINRRLQRGRIGAVDSGNYISPRPPYGYQIKKEGKGNRYLVPDPDQAIIVKMIFEWYTNDDSQLKMGSNKIANELNRIGHLSPTGKLWEASTVLFLLKNAVYAGRIQWKKKEIKKSITIGKKKDARTRPREEWIDVEGKHEPIVSMDTYLKAQDILKRKYHVPYQHQNGIVNPLAGLIRCDMCGSSMVLRSYAKQQHSHIMCYNRNCSNRSARFSYVEERIIEGLKLWLHQYKTEWEKLKKTKVVGNSIDFQEKSLLKISRELKDLSEQKGRLHDFLEQGIYDIKTYLERSTVLAERSALTQKVIEDLEKQIDTAKNSRLTHKNIIPQVEHVLNLYYMTDEPAKKNNLLKSVLEYVTYRKEKNQRDDDFALLLHPKIDETTKYPLKQK